MTGSAEPMMQSGTAAVGAAALLYLVASVGFQKDLFSGTQQHWRRWRIFLWVGFVLHTVGLMLLTGGLGHFPISGLAEAAGTLGWMMVLLYLAFGPLWKVEVMGTVAAPAAFGVTATSLAALTLADTPGPAQSTWTVVHVASVVLGYGAFTLAAGCAGLYLVQARLLKQKNLTGMFRRLPPLQTLDRVAYRLILVGFIPMVVGIVTGMLLMQGRSGVLWIWEPKQTLVALTGLIYVLYLHARLLAGWQGRKVNIMLLVAFLCVLVSYLAPGDFHRF